MRKKLEGGLTFFRQFNLVTIGAAIFLVILLSFLSFNKLKLDFENSRNEQIFELTQRVSYLDNLINNLARQVSILENECQHYDVNPLSSVSARETPLFQYLHQSTRTDYALDKLPTALTSITPGLLGKGDLHKKLQDKSFVYELGLQSRLALLFPCIKKEFPEITWVYAISDNDFVHIFPYVTSNDVQYDTTYESYDIFKMATPSHNPQRSIFVTPAYLDAGGAGLMVSIGKPYYMQEVFGGVLGIDITLSFLNEYVASVSSQEPGAQVFIVNEFDQVLASSGGLIPASDTVVSTLSQIAGFTTDTTHADTRYTLNGRPILSVAFSKVPWKIMYVPQESIWYQLEDGVVYFGLLLGITLLLLFLLFFTRHNFIKPARELANYIEQQSMNKQVQPEIHFAWRYWFELVRGSFEMNRRIIDKLDLSVKQKTRELLISNESLTKANAAKDKIFSVIAHDLRSPIQSLMNLLDMFNKGYVSVDEFNQYMISVKNSVKRTKLMLDDLLQWSLHNLSAKTIQLKKVVLNHVIQEMVAIYQPIAEEKSLKIVTENMPALALETDQSIIELVLRNLLMNAIKFSHRGGTITVSLNQYGGQVIIQVSDTGVGIAPEVMATLFSAGKTAGVGTSNEVGTGLGLSLCEGFLHKIGGKIWVESVQGHGSTFSFSIPVHEHTELLADSVAELLG